MPDKKISKVHTGLRLDPAHHAALRRLSDETRVPLAVYLREAIADLLAKYKVPKPRAKR